MDRLFEALRPAIRTIVRHPGQILLGALILTALCLTLALRLRIDTDFARLLPEHFQSVQALERLKETVGGESALVVAIESPSFAADTAFAAVLIPKILALTDAGGEPYLRRVEYKKDITFIQQNALYFATEAELDQLEQHLQQQIEDARLEANPFFFDLDDEFDDDEDAESEIDLNKTYREIVPKSFPVSDDSTTLVLTFYPTGSKANVGYVEPAYRDVRALVASLPKTHPEMQVTVGGALERQTLEIRAVTRDVAGSLGGGVSSVLFIVMVYFFFKALQARKGRKIGFLDLVRMPVATLLIAVPLVMSLTWTFALAYMAYGFLNLMTSTLMLVLFGLGVDYGVHFYARYAEERALGHHVTDAIETTFVTTGPPIAVSALTTAVSLFVLMAADFQGFSQFGAIAGTGILLALLAMITILPALTVLFEKWHLVNLEPARVSTTKDHAENIWRYPASGAVVALCLLGVAVALFNLPRVSFEYRFSELEPDMSEYKARREIIRKVYPPSEKRNAAYIVVDDPAEITPIETAIREKAAADTVSPTILSVESLQERYATTPAQQQHRLARIETIRTLLDDPYLKASDDEDLARLRLASQTREPIPLEIVPEYLKERFTARDGTIGNFVMIYPSVGLSDGRHSMAFAEDVGKITTADRRIYHAGSTSLVAADMLRLLLDESPWMILLTAVVLFLLMWLVFRSIRWTLLAGLPLVIGVLWMLGVMELFDVRLNFYNLIVLPAVLGIGNDTGIHLVYRYREEGKRSLGRVLRSTGEHITVGALTTMIGFAWWMFSFHPGLNSIGLLAVIGIGTVLLAALLFLPALLQWLEDRDALVGQKTTLEPEKV